MKNLSNYIAAFIFFVFTVICSTINAQTQLQKTEKEINVQEYFAESRLNVEVKEFFIRQIRKTELVKPIDNHEFVHFFLDRYDSKYKSIIKVKFNHIAVLQSSKIKAIADDIIAALASDFNQYKVENPTAKKDENKNVNMRHFDLFNLGSEVNKGPGQPCNNADFETGDATGWDLSDGNVDSNPYGYINVVPTGLNAQHVIMTGGVDAIGGFPRVNPDGGASSLMLGDGTGTGYMAAGASQTFLVDANSEAFTYSYALVLEDPGSSHSLGEKPFFKVNMYDQAGNSIACGDYSVIANSGIDPAFIPYGSGPQGYYLPWRTTFAPLQGYVGQNVTIEFITGDCGQGGHYGYGYIDASCQPLEIIPTQAVICGGNPVTLSAPAGAASYLWSPGGQTTQSITTNVPGTYTVDIIPVTGPGCGLTLTSTITGSPDYPVAQFTANPLSVCVGTPITFTNTSYVVGPSLIDSVEWDFNSDGIVDDVNFNTTYTYPLAGNYTATLTIYNNGCIDDTTVNITISAQPTAIFSHTTECFGATTAFTDLSNPNGGTISNWDWDFTNNGTVDNASQNPTNGYPAAGSYTVELLVTTTDGCVDSTTMLVVVNPIPFADFSVADVCFGTISTFTDLSTISTGAIIDWQWNFGDLLTTTDTSSLQNPTYNYTIPGTYPVTLTITSDSGCINTVIDSAHVLFLPTAAFTANNECFNAVASFTDNSNGNGGIITNWLWDFDNNGTTDNTNQNPTNLYPSPNTYTIQLIVSTGFGCADTTTQPITIYPMPVADFTFVNACFGAAIAFTDNSSVTSGTITNWNWNFGNSNTSIVQNPSENYSSEGVYNVQLIASTNNACSDTIVQQIEVWPIPVVDFSPTEVCLNAASQFTDLSTVSSTNTTNNIIQWQWNFGDGVGTSNLQNPIYTYTTEGIYPTILTVTSNHGCFYDTTINVTVNPLPQVIFGDPTAGCAPNMCVNFVNNSTINQTNLPASIDTWQWDFGDDFSSTSMNPSHCYENSSYSVVKNYDVTLTATSNKQCVTTVTIPQLITVYPKPLADFDYTPLETDIYDSKITFIDQSIIASQWFWNLGDGATSTESNPIHNYADSGFYSVTLYMENVYGCRDTTQKTVRIKPTFAIWIPNTFTPDGDGINDYFFVDGYGIKELQTFVFDRWGMLLFDGYFLDSKWSGFYKGKKCQEDVYVYKIRAKDVFNEWHEYIGKITLLK